MIIPTRILSAILRIERECAQDGPCVGSILNACGIIRDEIGSFTTIVQSSRCPYCGSHDRVARPFVWYRTKPDSSIEPEYVPCRAKWHDEKEPSNG